MHSRTIAALDRLEKASWFSRVGVDEGPSVAVLTSWPAAIDLCDTSEWEDLRLDALNQCCECIARRAKNRMQAWNKTVDEVKKITEPLIDRKIAAIVRDEGLPELFRTRVRYDITNFCMETEYADVCPPGFCTTLGDWYVKGHFPCGWWGVFPQGKLVVY
jgi:hypothetical protein